VTPSAILAARVIDGLELDHLSGPDEPFVLLVYEIDTYSGWSWLGLGFLRLRHAS
jgi:hypothetical protein